MLLALDTRDNIYLSDRLNLTNNSVEGTNNLISNIIPQGRISVEQFGEMINSINSCFDAKKITKEKKLAPTYQKKTLISNIMLFLARCSNNTNIIKGMIFFNFSRYIKFTLCFD